MSPQDFADRFIADHHIDLRAEQFLAQFNSWIIGFYPGALSLLRKLSITYRLGIFSNISEAHWQKVYPPLKESGHITHFFASYEIGLVKPDLEAFLFIARELGVPPQSIFFLDDNVVNVEGAKNAGYVAHLAKGLEGAKEALNRYGIVS